MCVFQAMAIMPASFCLNDLSTNNMTNPLRSVALTGSFDSNLAKSLLQLSIVRFIYVIKSVCLVIRRIGLPNKHDKEHFEKQAD